MHIEVAFYFIDKIILVNKLMSYLTDQPKQATNDLIMELAVASL